jgi:protein-S-isoprenylcysteine O-methyltransferase Ste14
MIGTMPTQGIDSAPRARFVSACDLGERLIVLAVYAGLVARLIVATWQEGQPANLLLIPSEGLVVVFLLFRRRTDQISLRWQDWLLALSATVSPMLVEPGVGQALVPVTLGATLLIMGTVVQVHAKLTLGRSFGCVPAHRGLKLAGPYRFVRHPMYAGYLLSHVAFLLMNPTLWNVAAYAMCYALQIPRLVAEERLLANDREYREYQAAVKYRLIPGIF